MGLSLHFCLSKVLVYKLADLICDRVVEEAVSSSAKL